MRRIIPQKEIEQIRKKRSRIFTFFILGILVFSSLGYAFFSNPNSGSNKSENIGESENGWQLQFGDQTHYFSNSPESVKGIIVQTTNDLGYYAGKVVYLSADSDLIQSEIASNMGRYVSRIQEACYGNCTDKNLPEKDCDSELIIWTKSDKNVVYQKDKCIFIEGDVKAVDAFLYKIFGINK